MSWEAARIAALEAEVERLQGLLRGRASIPPGVGPIAALAHYAASQTGVSVAELRGASREARVVRVRFAVVWAARGLGASTPQIGRALNRDHTTAVAGIRRAGELRERDPLFRALTDELVARFGQKEEAACPAQQ